MEDRKKGRNKESNHETYRKITKEDSLYNIKHICNSLRRKQFHRYDLWCSTVKK
jgi:hypothetical protein